MTAIPLYCYPDNHQPTEKSKESSYEYKTNFAQASGTAPMNSLRHAMKRLVAVLLIVSGFSFALFLPTANAAALSFGCYSWNSFNGTSHTGMTVPSRAYNQGETLSISASGTFDVTGVSSVSSVRSFSYTFPSTGSYTVAVRANSHSNLTWTIHCGVAAASTLSDGVTFWNFTDGRINSHDGAQTAAVYCEDGGVTVYAVVKSVGTRAFKVTRAQLDAVPTKPEHNTLIKSGQGVSLYRLTTGELQINAPDNYVFTWDGCPAT